MKLLLRPVCAYFFSNLMTYDLMTRKRFSTDHHWGNCWPHPADKRRNDAVIMTSKRRCDVVLTSYWRYYCAVYPLGVTLVDGTIDDDVIKWKHFPRYWPFVRGIHRSPVNSPHKGQWRGALMFTLICARINGWVNNREAGDLRRFRAHYDVIVMRQLLLSF